MSRRSKRTVVHLVAGARPNFVKIAPLFFALQEQDWCEPVLVHTGQHFDEVMFDAIWQDLGLPRPDLALGVGRGPHGKQTGSIMIAYEQACLAARPNWVVVAGDVNSTLACALVAKKLGIRVAHLEAGLRSRDLSMPEEINRICTDAISDLLWTPSPDADENLRNEGIDASRIVRVGNIMLDSLERMRPRIARSDQPGSLGLAPKSYGVVTLHRPSNIDNEPYLRRIVDALTDSSSLVPLVFPIHPRTRARLAEYDLECRLADAPRLHCLEPLAYSRFMSLVLDAGLVITDSGGIQEETTYLGIPCLTVRDTTERPITIAQGTNKLVALKDLVAEIESSLTQADTERSVPEFWDGKTADRAVASLRRAAGAIPPHH